VGTGLASDVRCVRNIESSQRDYVGGVQRTNALHEYGQIDHELLYKTATEDVPQLIALLEQRLPGK
jgi:hypothetical protein